MPIYVKILKQLLLKNREILGAEASYGIKHQGLTVYQGCSIGSRSLTFYLFTVRSNLRPIDLYGENVEKSFSEKVFILMVELTMYD